MASNRKNISQELALHIAIFATVVFIFYSPAVINTLFPAASALTVPEDIQFISSNASSTEVQESPASNQEAITNHLDMARQAVRNGNLTMAVQELISAIELQSAATFGGSEVGQNETGTRAELQTAPFPPE
jgi:hypothetical protein